MGNEEDGVTVGADGWLLGDGDGRSVCNVGAIVGAAAIIGSPKVKRRKKNR